MYSKKKYSYIIALVQNELLPHSTAAQRLFLRDKIKFFLSHHIAHWTWKFLHSFFTRRLTRRYFCRCLAIRYEAHNGFHKCNEGVLPRKDCQNMSLEDYSSFHPVSRLSNLLHLPLSLLSVKECCKCP
jgi:hypothetical protein